MDNTVFTLVDGTGPFVGYAQGARLQFGGNPLDEGELFLVSNGGFSHRRPSLTGIYRCAARPPRLLPKSLRAAANPSATLLTSSPAAAKTFPLWEIQEQL